MEPPPNHQQLKTPKRKTKGKCIIADTFYANCRLVPIPGLNGKYKLDLNKIEEQELIILPPEEKDSRLLGWKVEVRQRTNGRHHDKFYTHIQNGAKFRSTPEVINYIENGKPKNENAKKPGRPPKRSKSEEDEANTDSHPAETDKDDKSLSEGSPRGLLQLDRASFCAELNEEVMNEWSGLSTSLQGGKGKGIVIHEDPPAGFQSKVGNLSVEGKGKGILIELIEENDDMERNAFGIYDGMFGPPPYTSIMQGGWSMEGGTSWNNNSLDMGMNGTPFGTPNPNLIANLHSDNQVPAPDGILPQNTIDHHPCKISGMQSFETNGHANIVDANNGEKNSSENPVNMDMDHGSLFDDVMPSEAEMDELMGFIYSDLEEEKEEEIDAVQNNEMALNKTFEDIIDDIPIVDSFYDRYWRDQLP